MINVEEFMTFLCLYYFSFSHLFNSHSKVYHDSRPPPPLPKGNKKFKILFVKMFSLKQKLNQILPVTKDKIKFCPVKKTASYWFGL